MKERLMVQTLIEEFIEKERSPQIALLIGIRRVGKTTILKQLHSKYKKSAYLSVDSYTEDLNNEITSLLDSGIDYLFIDEFTSIYQYDILAQELYNEACAKNVKIILTGSSPYHLYELSYRKLGGGRSSIFKLPPITFIEYLYFTDKIPSYDDIDSVNNNYFVDYLKLDGLTAGLKIDLNTDYFKGWSKDNEEVNDNTTIGKSQNDISEEDILDIFNLIAYNLVNSPPYKDLIRPKIGGKEHNHLFSRRLGYKLSKIDLTNLLVEKSSNNIVTLDEVDIARILLFLIDSGIAIVSIADSSKTINNVRDMLKVCSSKSDMSKIFRDVVIILASPLFYVRIGEEIFKRFGVTLDVLDKGPITGMLLEVYLSGGIINLIRRSSISQYKLTSDNRDDIQEVDIFVPSEMILIESTIEDKKGSEIYLDKYYIDKLCIRVCSSKTKYHMTEYYHIIPYTTLMCLIDTGKILTLKRSSKTELLKNL